MDFIIRSFFQNKFILLSRYLLVFFSLGITYFSQAESSEELLVGDNLIAGEQMVGRGAVRLGYDPFDLESLPKSTVKRKMLEFKKNKRRRAQSRLNKLKIPASDFVSIDVDDDGEFFYLEPSLPKSTITKDIDKSEMSEKNPLLAMGLSANQVFSLHSRLGAPNTIYLDFDGHVVTGTVWNREGDYDALPYDRDGNPYSFSESELNDITKIWYRVSEDYKAFNVDVTTEMPAQFNARTGHVLITHKIDANGKAMPYHNNGGIAYVGVWGRSNYAYYQPAMVYYSNLGGGAPHFVAESAAHEMGHNVGLFHDGTASSVYYSGHGSGLTRWAPIMGNSFKAQVSQWSKGDYSGANNTQDDIDILKNTFGFIADDHGNSANSATLLDINSDGAVTSTTPKSDPNNYFYQNKGIIHAANDIDYFQFESGSGQLMLSVTPGWQAYREEQYRGSNLDILIKIYDQNRRLLQTINPENNTNAALSLTVNAGTYYLSVEPSGSSDYSAYASAGQYFITGTIPQGVNGEDESNTQEENNTQEESNNEEENVTEEEGTTENDDPIINTQNIRPTAVNDSATVFANETSVLDLLSNDNDPNGDSLTIINFRQPLKGTATLNADQTISYRPDNNYIGKDKIDYWLFDGALYSSMGSVYITVNEKSSGFEDQPEEREESKEASNQRPVAKGERTVVLMNNTSTLYPLSNDTDINGDALSIVDFRLAKNGVAKLNDNQTLSYTPNQNFTGFDEIDYWITDGQLISSMATLSIMVESSHSENIDSDAESDVDSTTDNNTDNNEVNIRPTTVTDYITVAKNRAIDIDIIANDFDPNDDDLRVIDFRPAKNGQARLNANNTINYTPQLGFTGTDRIDYWLTDGELISSMAIVYITVLDE